MNVRVPRGIANEVKRTQIVLAIDGRDMPGGIRDKVITSLRTRMTFVTAVEPSDLRSNAWHWRAGWLE